MGVPFVDSQCAVRRGILISKLELSGDITKKPEDHVCYWMGEHPCHADGSKITSIQNPSAPLDLAPGMRADFTFSAKADYRDYHHKMTTYIGRISGEAAKLDPDAVAKDRLHAASANLFQRRLERIEAAEALELQFAEADVANGRRTLDILNGFVSDIVTDPNDPTILYAATLGDGTQNIEGNSAEGGVFRSIDSGFTWTRIPALPATQLALPPADLPNNRALSLGIAGNPATLYVGTAGRNVVRLTPSTAAFTVINGTPPNQITNNIISVIGGANWTTTAGKAIYLDDEMSNIVVTGNICWRCGEWAFQIHGGDHVTMENNIFDLSSAGTQLALYQKSAAYPDYGMAANLLEHNIIYSATSFPSSLYQVGISGTDALPTDTSNLYFSANSSSIPNTNIVDVNRILANPQFTNPSVGDYSMPSNSPAFTSAGFQPLPTDQGPVGQASFPPIGTSSKPAPPTNVTAVAN